MEENDVSRRDFVKISAAAAAVAGAAAAASSVPAFAASGSASSASASVASGSAKTAMTPGTYTGKATGYYGGTIVMDVTVSEDAIEDVVFKDNIQLPSEVIPAEADNPYAHYAWMVRSDSPQILQTAVDRLPQRIIDAQSVKVDSVTGATYSSLAIKNAVADCITQAGGNVDDFSAEPVKNDTTQDLGDFDVIVVGAGTSGTLAAASATDAGARVLLIEKSGRVGGTGALSTEPCTLGAKIQLDQGWDNSIHDYYESLMSMNHWFTSGVLMMEFLNQTASTIDWMVDTADFPFVPEFTNNPDAVHESDRLFGDCLVEYATDSVEYTDACEAWQRLASPIDTILYETAVTELIQDADGKVTGVKGEEWDGSTVTASAPAIIFACGGFAGNPEMMVQYNKYNYNLMGLYQNQGTTLQLLEPIGAQKEHVGGLCAHYTDVVGELSDDFDDYEKNCFFSIHCAQTFLHVNSRGQRFCSENEKAISMLSSSAYATAQGPKFYAIFSQQQADTLRDEGLAGTGLDAVSGVAFFHYPVPVDYKMANIDSMLEYAIEQGFVYKGDTIDDLAAAVGFDTATFESTMDIYESACENGEDDLFFKDASFLFPMGTDGPYYALECVVRPYNSLGGVKVDQNFHVLDNDNVVIPGIYAVGVDAIGNILDGVYYPDHRGIAFGWGLNSGYLAGKSAAKDVLGA